MTPERLGALICLVAVTAIAIARLPSVIRHPRARPSWAAVVVGAAAFFSRGALVPLETLDAALGGQNYINLVQNSLAVTAFWLMLEAAKATITGDFAWRRAWRLLVMISTFALPFLAIRDRQGTSSNFIDEFADQWALWAYASIYMGWVVVLTVSTIIVVRGRRSVMYFAIRFGCCLIAAGSVIEIAYLTLRVAGNGSVGVVEIVRLMFAPLFYGGVAMFAAGLAGFWLVRTVRELVLNLLRAALRRGNTLRGLDHDVLLTGDAAVDAYRMAVMLVDIGNVRGLGWMERTVLAMTTRMLDRQTKAPRIVKMKAEPSGVLS